MTLNTSIAKCSPDCEDHNHEIRPGLCSWRYRLLKHSYWRRVWIIQELLLASSVIIWFYDTTIITLQDMLTYIMMGGGTSQVYMLINQALRKDWKPLKLINAIAYCKHAHCADPRDYLYGMQALLIKEHRITVDYTKDTTDVFVDAVLKILQTHQLPLRLSMELHELSESMGITDWWKVGHAETIVHPIGSVIKLAKIYEDDPRLTHRLQEILDAAKLHEGERGALWQMIESELAFIEQNKRKYMD